MSSTKVLTHILDNMQVEYSIVDEHNADIFAEIPVTRLVKALSVENCEVYSLKEREESFYMNLMGGEQHA